ncbi:MAG: diacylglyceryl transferase [Alphaproteobacteria bacterium]|nr:diacylglyceryl transferase [Alphaproteobacteria bacterium]
MNIPLPDRHQMIHDYLLHTSFDIAGALAFLGAVYLSWKYRFHDDMGRLSRKLSPRYFSAIGFGAVTGAYALGTVNNVLMGENAPARSILGGLAGAVAAVEIWKRRHGLKGSTGYIHALPLSLMIAVGRLGCANAGLEDNTYGIPTHAGWGQDFGDGVLRWPTAFMESADMAALSLFLFVALWKRTAWYPRLAFYIFIGFYGAQRFVLEFLKPYPAVIGGLNVFHLACLGMVGYALFFARLGARRGIREQAA